MKYLICLFSILSFFFVKNSYGQSYDIDSLQTLLVTQKGIEKIKTLDELVWELRRKPDSLGIKYAFLGLKLSKERNYHLGEAIFLNRLGNIAKRQKKYQDSENYLLESLEIAETYDIDYSIARAHNELGSLYEVQYENVKAAYAFQNAYATFMKLKNKKAAAKALFNLGKLYMGFDDYKGALEYYLESVELREEIKDSLGLARSYSGLAILNKYLKNYEEMLQYSTKSYDIFKSIGNEGNTFDKKVSIGNAYSLLNKNKLAKKTYLEAIDLIEPYDIKDPSALFHSIATLYRKDRNLDSAMYYYNESIKILKRKEDFIGLSYSYNNLGNLFLDLNEKRNSLSYFHKSLMLQKRTKDSSILEDTYKSISNYYIKSKDYEKAFLYKDSSMVVGERNNKKIKASDRFEVDYLKERKKSDDLKNKNIVDTMKSERKNTIIFGLIVLFIITSILFFVFFRSKKLAQEKKITELAYQQHKIEVELAKEKQQQELEELLQDQERKAISKMIDGQEEERARIADDLHDRLGSMLSVVKMHYKSVEDDLEKIKKETKSQYEKANQLLDEACDAVRKIAHNMVSGTLTKFGLLPALEELRQTIEAAKTIQIELVWHGLDDRLNNKKEIQIYRVIQELLNNVLKHAQATEVTIQLLKGENEVNILVIDNGVGFEVGSIILEDSMGLRSIKARVKEMKGSFTIDSGKGNGTTVNIDIPIIDK